MFLPSANATPERRVNGLLAKNALMPASAWVAAAVLVAVCPAASQTPGPAPTAPQAPRPVQLAEGEGSKGVEEVVVTARHRNEKAQTVPIALTALSAAKLNNTGTASLDKLQLLVPSLQVIEANPRNISFNIRGVGANVSITNDGLEGGVGVYIDGVLYARPGQAAFDFPDIESVQVLRGPQGTLFGKNATAGAIDVRTRLPSTTPEAELETTFGNYGLWQVKGTASDALTDKISGRISFLADQRDGTISTIGADHHFNTLDDKAVRVQLVAQATDDLTLRFIADYAHQLENCCIGLPTGVFTTLENGTILPNNFYKREAFLDYQVPSYNPFDYKSLSSHRTDFEMETAGGSLQADYNLGGYTLTSISSWRFWNWWPYNGDVSATGIDVFDDSAQIDWEKQASQELRVTSPTGGAVDYTGGLYFFYEDLPGYLHSAYGPQAGPYLLGAKVPKAISTEALNGFNVQANTDPVTNSYASYGQATWHVFPLLDLTGGLRYTYEDKSGSFDQSVFGGLPLLGLPPKLKATIAGIRKSIATPLYYNDHTHNAALSYLATASTKITPDLFAYATYSRGNKSGGINVVQLPPGVDAVVKPERLDNYEIGVKSTWLNNKLTVNADVFWIEDSDYQGVAVAPLSTGVYTFFLANVPKVQSRGFEFDSHAQPTDWLSLNLAGAYTDAIYESYPQGQCPPEVAGAATKICDLTGKPVPGTSRYTLSAGGEISQPVGRLGRYDLVGYLGADFSLRSNFYVAANDSKYALVPGFGLLDLRLGARTSDGRYDAFLWSHNATNTHYFTTIGAASPVSGLISGDVGDPITFGVTLRVHL